MNQLRTQWVAVATLSAVSISGLAAQASGKASDFPPTHGGSRSSEVTYAIIGDTPYGDEQVDDFGNLVAALNQDHVVSGVVHVGDIKSGSTLCSDEHFAFIYDSFASLEYPVFYTPGDNEWTDCHRTAAGKYDPIERLDAIRDVFFSTPFRTLGGQPRFVLSQTRDRSYRDIPENQAWIAARTVFSLVHVVGSRNNLAPWFGDDLTDALEDDPERREAEVEHRTAAALAWIDKAFDAAERSFALGVVLIMHADTWPGGENDGFSEIIRSIAERSVELEKPVLVIQGDSHTYKVDQPLVDGDLVHGVDFSVPNLTRIVVEGATTGEYMRLKVDPKSDDLFSWDRVQL